MNAAELATLAASVDLDDSEIEQAAERLAGQVVRLVRAWAEADTPEAVALKTLRKIARQHHVSLPARDSFTQRLNRMRDAAWWRRALRQRLRIVERQAIRCGQVHRHASPYLSAKGLRRFERDRRRLDDLLSSLEAMNASTGEVIPLEDVIARSQANPQNRRRAMMARIKGVEAHAKAQGHDALFLTITAPSRMHARHASGQANCRFDGTGPREAQAHLHSVWRGAMRKMQRDGLRAYGLRTVEPHHDGCPHWHVLLFAAPGQAEGITAALRAYALADSPDEPGAAEHRFKVERIDPTKGSALAYVAKYVAKSIDGEGIDLDDESACNGAETARRIVAWSRRWGIRQFQFFGLPAITPMRELHKMPDAEVQRAQSASRALGDVYEATMDNDYAAYLGALDRHCIRLSLRYLVRPSTRYPEELAHAIRGLTASAFDLAKPLDLDTRTELWVIQPRQSAHEAARSAEPWTRFNNCARPEKSTGYLHSDGTPPMPAPVIESERRRRRPPDTRPAPPRAYRNAETMGLPA